MTVLVFGSAIVDQIFRTAALPLAGETVLAETSPASAGGKGLNQAVAAARAGARVSFFGAVGRDANAALLRQALEDAGVAAHLTEVEAPTGMAAVVVDAQGRNQIAVAPAANMLARAPEVPAGTLVMLQMEVPPAENAAMILRARSVGARSMLNLAPAATQPELSALNWLVVNEPEAAWLASQLGRAPDAAALAAALGIGVARTLAERGAEYAGPEGRFHVPAFPIAVTDSVGAGDAWCGALAAALHARVPMGIALRRANAAGALACTRPGAWAPTAAEIDALL
ncbi:ribokinase [Rhodovarius crocodyli]|uniref:Ribokinase n=1 Tax=Rhodovarius crocodyli TaxID=1979269 RepID=A0A437MPI2_9PROT|nr:PfkB family carbohydrate kinase [Rhodovarius crocodyli]RVT99554.1 ribokinase [Rhodovarius crocodyli]